jgi:peroxiredoxin
VLVTTAVIWSLVEQNRVLKARINETTQIEDPRAFFAVGDLIPDVALVDTSGTRSSLLAELEGGGVIAFLTTTCPYCAESLAAWQHIEEHLREVNRPLIGVSLHPAGMTQEYVARRGVTFPVWTAESPAEQANLKVGAVPFTVAVDAEGRVQQVWRGSIDEATANSVIAALLEQAARAIAAASAPDEDPLGR